MMKVVELSNYKYAIAKKDWLGRDVLFHCRTKKWVTLEKVNKRQLASCFFTLRYDAERLLEQMTEPKFNVSIEKEIE